MFSFLFKKKMVLTTRLALPQVTYAIISDILGAREIEPKIDSVRHVWLQPGTLVTVQSGVLGVPALGIECKLSSEGLEHLYSTKALVSRSAYRKMQKDQPMSTEDFLIKRSFQ